MTFPNFSFTQQAYTRGPGTTGTFWPIISDRNPTASDVFFGSLTYNVGQLWFNTVLESMWILDSFTNVKSASNPAGQVQARWVDFITNNSQLLSLSDNSNLQVFPSLTTDVPPSNIQLEGQLNQQVTAFSTTVGDVAGHIIKINPMSTARWIVDPLSTTAKPNGTHTTIGAALLAASSGDTIVIMPGIYSENLSLKAGVTLTAYEGDSFNPNVTILGTCTMLVAGSSTISCIRLKTNGSHVVSVTGSAASSVTLKNCYIDITNNTAFLLNTSGGGALTLYNCVGNIGATGIALFTMANNNGFTIFSCRFTNDGNSTTASTTSAGTCNFQQSEFNSPITTSGTSRYSSFNNNYNCSTVNSIPLTVGGTGGAGVNVSSNDYFDGGSAAAISIGSNLTVTLSTIVSSNAPALTGAGTINYAGLVFAGSNSTNSVNTKNLLVLT